MKNKRKRSECFILGTRPEIIKMAPLILKMKPFVLHTGQHRSLATEAFEIFDITPDINLELMSHNQKVLDFLVKGSLAIARVLEEKKPERIWVQGDTMSAYIGALYAWLEKIPLVHIEAGLRTHNSQNPYPEEMFRVMIDQLADLLFAPTKQNVKNLKEERVKGRIYQVGNTIVDSLEMIKPKLPDKRPIKDKYVLVTTHRRESFNKDIYTVFKVIKQLSKEVKIILPAHPNPNVQKAIKQSGIEAIKPLNYLEFLWHLRDCEMVISDSGGIIEECPSFNKKILIIRKVIERPEILETGFAFTSTLKEKDLQDKINQLMSMGKIQYTSNPFGSGNTAEKIINIIKNEKI